MAKNKVVLAKNTVVLVKNKVVMPKDKRTEFKPMQSIWDYAPPETLGTVDEQEAYCDAFDRERMKGSEG